MEEKIIDIKYKNKKELTSVTENKGKDDEKSKGTSTSVVSRPLIYPDELGHLGGGETGEE